MSKETLLILYYSFIYPYLTYCNTVWGNTCQSYLNQLVKLQKRAVRIICNKPKLAHSLPLLQELRIFNLKEIFIYSVQLFSFKFNTRVLPSIFESFYTFNHSVHHHNTRQHNGFHTTKTRTVHGSKIIRHAGVRINNYFIKYMHNDCSLITYKKHLKKHIMEHDVSFLYNDLRI